MYTGFIDFQSRLDGKNKSIQCGTHDSPEKCHEQMERIVKRIQPMNGNYSTCVVEHGSKGQVS